MPIMSWDESLDVGVKAMNAEHRDILDAMNAIFDATAAGETGPRINRLVGRLGEVCISHFRDEEAFMKKCAFPDLDLHARIHAKLLTDYTQHAKTIEAAGGRVEPAFFHFLRYWLTAHIKGVDRKYGDHAKQAHIAA